MGLIREMIEQRAYELFLKRGGIHGYHMEDWMQAEKEVLAEAGGNKRTEVRQPVVPEKRTAAPAPQRTASSRQAPYQYGKRR
jgi:hypothetical protein